MNHTLKKEALEIVESVVDGKEFFVVDTHISQIRGTWIIKASIDSDTGIGIDECGQLSRLIHKKLEENFSEVSYDLEITSPGVGEVLKLHRQYIKNIGRNIRVSLLDGKELVGKLLAMQHNNDVLKDKIVLEEFEKKKGKIINTKQIEILLAAIKKTVVEISFN